MVSYTFPWKCSLISSALVEVVAVVPEVQGEHGALAAVAGSEQWRGAAEAEADEAGALAGAAALSVAGACEVQHSF